MTRARSVLKVSAGARKTRYFFQHQAVASRTVTCITLLAFQYPPTSDVRARNSNMWGAGPGRIEKKILSPRGPEADQAGKLQHLHRGATG